MNEQSEYQKAFAAMREAVDKVRDHLRGANLLPDEPPTDPKERALWLKEHRSTGPEKPKDWRKR